MKQQIIVQPSSKVQIVEIEIPLTYTITIQEPITTTTTTTQIPATTTTTTSDTRKNIIFQSLGSEDDAITKWPVKGTSTSYGIVKSTTGNREAIKFEIRKSDPIFAGGVRAELNLYSDTTKSYPYEVWYGMSYYIPINWVNDQPNLFDVINQWHDEGGSLKSPFDFNIDAGVFMAQVRSAGVEKRLEVAPIEKGRWIDFVFHIKFVKSGNGLVEIWKDGNKVVNYTGVIGYNSATLPPFFKMGLYKWPWNPENLACCGATNSTSHTIYISNFRLGNELATYNDVKP